MQAILSILLIAFLHCTWPVDVAHADAEMGRLAGQQAGETIRSQIDSADEINQRLAQPLTSEHTPMRTFGPESEQESFNAQLTAPSSDVFVELFAQPGPSGDLTGVSIRQDTDFDGNPDYVFNVPVRVSGVCANGIISCDAGAWDNCAYYTWIANDHLEVSLVQKPSIGSLAACYCINNSCGGELVWNNLGLVLKDLGGGAVASVQSRDPHCTITNVAIEGPVIRYYGQKTGEMASGIQGVYLSGPADPEQFYGAGALPVDEEVAGQASDPGSYYSQLQAAFSAQPDAGFVGCTVSHNIGFSATGNTGIFDGQVGVAGNNYWGGSTIVTISDTVNLGPSRVTSAFITYVGYDDAMRIYVNGHLAWQDWPGCYERGTSFYSTPWAPVSPDYFTGGDNALHAAICIQGGGEGWFGYHIETSEYDPYLTTSGTCDPGHSCRLKEEEVCDSSGVNCVQTWHSFNPTGLSPLPMCETVTSADVGTYTACMDGSTATVYMGSYSEVVASGEDLWWRIERVYLCESEGEYDFDNVSRRTRHIRNTAQDNVTTLYFEDYDPETGLVTPRTVDLPERFDYEACEKACKLRKQVEDTEAGAAGTTADYRTTVESYVYLYRKCDGDTCPDGSGEEVIKDCACLNEFEEEASIMQVLDNAAEDLVCDDYDGYGNCIGDIHIFSGGDRRCRSDGLTIGFDDCCKDDEYWFGLGQCRVDERELATSKAEDLCHYIGEYCSEEIDLGFAEICIEHSKTYCCFNSKLSRIVHEQGRSQLQGDISTWGTAEAPSCRGFTPEEFQMLDFSGIDLSEWFGDIEVKAQDQIKNEMQEAIEGFYYEFTD